MKTFIDIISLGYAINSSIFLVVFTIKNSPKCIASDEMNFGKDIYTQCEQRAFTIVGVVFILLSFIFGLLSLLKPLTWNDLDISLVGLIIGIIVLIVSYKAGIFLVKYLRKKYYNMTKKLLENMAVEIEVYELVHRKYTK